jgi:hypothetical protein
MSETRSHLYNQQEVNAIVAEKLEPLLDFGAWGGASSSVSLNRINRPPNLITIRHLGPFFRWMCEVPLASTKECRPNSGAFVETPAVMTFGNDLPRRPAIWACAVAVGSGVSVPIMRLEGEFFVGTADFPGVTSHSRLRSWRIEWKMGRPRSFKAIGSNTIFLWDPQRVELALLGP